MISKLGLLTVASVLAMACSSSSGGGGTGGAGNMMPGGNMGGNNGPLTAGVLGPDLPPDSTDMPPNATDPAPNATDPAPSATDPAPNATDEAPGGGSAAGGGGVVLDTSNCQSLCHSLAGACPGATVSEGDLEECMQGCSEVPAQCIGAYGAVGACYVAEACIGGTLADLEDDQLEAACASVVSAAQGCAGGGVVQPGPGQGEGGQPSVPAGGSGCAGLEACCNSLGADLSATCLQAYNGAVVGGDAVCNQLLGVYQASAQCQ